MPRLPEYLAQTGLPASGGSPRGTVPIPVVPEPGAQAQEYTQTAAAVAGLGTALQQGAGLLSQAEALRAHQQRAQDTLDEKTQYQDTRVGLQTLLDKLREGDYQTLPETFLRDSDALISEQGARLNPQARALFVEDAKQYRAVLHQQALAERTQRRNQATQYAVMREVETTQTMYARATTDFERAFFQDQLEGLMGALVDTGLVDGGKAATLMQQTMQGAEISRAELLAKTAPRASLDQWMQGPEANPQLPPAVLPRLIDAAQKEVRELDALEHQRQLRAQQLVTQGRERTAATFTGQISAATTEAALDLLKGQVTQLAQDPGPNGLSEQYQRQLLGDIEARRARLQQGGERQASDGVALRAWEQTLLESKGDRLVPQLRNYVSQVLRDPRLTTADATRLAGHFQAEIEASHITKVDGYADSLRRLEQTFSGSPLNDPFGTLATEEKQHEALAIQEFRARVQAVLDKDGRNAASRQMPQIADEVMTTFNTRVFGALRDKLKLPPPGVPHQVYDLQPDLSQLNDSDITRRYQEGIKRLTKGVQDGLWTQMQAYGYLDQLNTYVGWEQKYWQELRKQGVAKAPQAELDKPPPTPSWWERFQFWKGGPVTPPANETPEQRDQRIREEARQKLQQGR